MSEPVKSFSDKISLAVSNTFDWMAAWFIRTPETVKTLNNEVMTPAAQTAVDSVKNVVSGTFKVFGVDIPMLIILLLAGGIGVLLLARKLRV